MNVNPYLLQMRIKENKGKLADSDMMGKLQNDKELGTFCSKIVCLHYEILVETLFVNIYIYIYKCVKTGIK